MYMCVRLCLYLYHLTISSTHTHAYTYTYTYIYIIHYSLSAVGCLDVAALRPAASASARLSIFLL